MWSLLVARAGSFASRDAHWWDRGAGAHWAATAPPPPPISGASVFGASSARRDLARDGWGERRREGAQERRFGGFARAE